jgi:hypothetical protein
MTVARTLALPGDAAAWARLGFAPGAPLGGVALSAGAPELELGVAGLGAERPDGLALVSAGDAPAGHGAHPNGATAIDHVVALTPDMYRTLAAPGMARGVVSGSTAPMVALFGDEASSHV